MSGKNGHPHKNELVRANEPVSSKKTGEDHKKQIREIHQWLQALIKKDIPNIEASLERLEGKRNADAQVLKDIQDKLRKAQKAIIAIPDKDSTLVDEVNRQWRGILAAVNEALNNLDLQRETKEKVKPLQAYVAKKISETSILKKYPNDLLIKAHISRFKQSSVKNMDKAIALTAYIEQPMK